MLKFQPSNFKIVEGEGLKNTRKSPFSMNKKFSRPFSKKVLGEKSVYIHGLHHLSKFGEHRFINKKNEKKSRNCMGPFN